MKCKLVLSFVVLLVFSSFSGYAQSSNNDQRIVGTWVSTYSGGTETFVFNANGSGTFTNTGDSSSNGPFTYGVSIDGEIITVGNFSSRGKIYFSPDGRTMIFLDVVFRKR